MCKNCLNCKHFNDKNYLFVDCKEVEADAFHTKVKESLEDEEMDINFSQWKDKE